MLTRISQLLKTAWAARNGRSECADDEIHLNAAVDWLLQAQRQPSEGYAHSYSFLRGWLPPYPETTGYIIPTLLTAGRHLGRDAVTRVSADRALGWLNSIQRPDGSFAALSGQPLVFDTGQILIGMNAGLKAGLSQYRRDVHEKAAHWLVSVQAEDGSFPRFAYNNRPHAYYSRVGAAMIVAGQLLQQKTVAEAGKRNLDWTADRLTANGFFELSSFDGGPAYLHTIVYVLEGLIDGYRYASVERWLQATLQCATALVAAAKGSLPRSQYAPDWFVANSEYCVTGLAQWAGLCYRLAQDHRDAEFQQQAERAVEQLKRWQFMSDATELHGGLPGSVPFGGRYMRWSVPNWGVKFFVDALLLRAGIETTP